MRFFDFFAGIGGFRLGMEMAGHECVGHCEIDKYADMSYRAMHHPKESEVFFTDVRTIKPGDMPECECYCFGFPCQSFSIAGNRGGFADTRGTLFFEVMRLAKERQPQILFAENVRGLLNHDGGGTFKTIINTMAELGYLVEWQVLDSQYFGVPQHRERVFIVGHLGGGSGRQVFPIRKDSEEAPVLQGQEDYNRVISNTLRVCGHDSVGTYVATDRQTDRQTDIPQGQWISQTIIGGNREGIKSVDIARTISARDSKGICNQGINLVISKRIEKDE